MTISTTLGVLFVISFVSLVVGFTLGTVSRIVLRQRFDEYLKEQSLQARAEMEATADAMASDIRNQLEAANAQVARAYADAAGYLDNPVLSKKPGLN